MNSYYGSQYSRPAQLFSLARLNVLQEEYAYVGPACEKPGALVLAAS